MLMSKIFTEFTPHPEIASSKSEFDLGGFKAIYANNYMAIFKAIADGKIDRIAMFRHLIKTDRFFMVHFIMGIAKANHPFVVKSCRMAEDGPDTGTIDVWAREHYKSVSITIAHTVQRIVNDPECTTAIFSYKKPAAEKFLDAIRKVLEHPIMIECFPEILYEKPETQAPSWSLQGGIRINRQSTSRKEHTVEAFGLIEGMPTGGHFDHRIYDDVETMDLAQNPDQLQICFERFEMSRNLGSDGGTEQIIGTYYSHQGVLVKLGNKKNIHGELMYKLRIIPATEDGTITGAPVLFSQEYLDSKKTDSTFYSQQLCNPTPNHDIKLRYSYFKEISRSELPSARVKFVIIDPAGDKEAIMGGKSDPWAMIMVSISPDKDDLGLSNVYIEDIISDTFALDLAISAACSLYRRSGRVSLLGIEQVGQSTHYKHIMDSLKQDHGVYLEIKKANKYGGNLLLLAPRSRDKNYRIESALSWPLTNGKLHIVDDIEAKSLLQDECDKFPFFHVNILDALSYLYDILADPTTPMILTGVKEKEIIRRANWRTA